LYQLLNSKSRKFQYRIIIEPASFLDKTLKLLPLERHLYFNYLMKYFIQAANQPMYA